MSESFQTPQPLRLLPPIPCRPLRQRPRRCQAPSRCFAVCLRAARAPQPVSVQEDSFRARCRWPARRQLERRRLIQCEPSCKSNPSLARDLRLRRAWVTTMIVRPSRCKPVEEGQISSLVALSRAPVGSSAKISARIVDQWHVRSRRAAALHLKAGSANAACGAPIPRD